jgi:hypothetical protein
MPRSIAAGGSILKIRGFRNAAPLDRHAVASSEREYAFLAERMIAQRSNSAKKTAVFEPKIPTPCRQASKSRERSGFPHGKAPGCTRPI